MIRLNKVLRELNISLELAVRFLEFKGIDIEPRPTSKISGEIYKLLLDRFDFRTPEVKPEPVKVDVKPTNGFDAQEWLDKANKLGIQLVHPSYNDNEEGVMQLRGAGGLRDAERNEDFESYLIIREAIRRHVKGKSTWKNNYIKLAVRAYERLTEKIVDDKLILTGDYYSNFSGGSNSGKHIPAGTKNDIGFMWVPYFRVYVPFEEFDLLNRIGKFKGTWNNTTLKIGKEKGDVAKYRQEAFVNGYADELLNRFNLPISYKTKLTLKYNSRG